MPRLIEIVSNTGESAQISLRGAELTSYKTAAGTEIMYQKDGEWDRQSPLLFPVVGQLVRDGIEVDGSLLPMNIHGFLRDLVFDVSTQHENSVTLTASETAATLASYPFKFDFSICYEFDGPTLSVRAIATNTDTKTIPLSFGYHPGFKWPLEETRLRDDYFISFSDDEPTEVPDILNWHGGGLLTSSVVNKRLKLEDDTFKRLKTVVLDHPKSNSVTYGAEHGASITVQFENLPYLAFWARPGGNWICIEPWDGHADPDGFSGSIWDKPAIRKVKPQEALNWTMRITYDDGIRP